MVRSESGPGGGQPAPPTPLQAHTVAALSRSKTEPGPSQSPRRVLCGRLRPAGDRPAWAGGVRSGAVSADSGPTLGVPLAARPHPPREPAVFGSLRHHQRPVSDRWEGGKDHSALPAHLTLGRTLLALPHVPSLQEASSRGGSQESAWGTLGPPIRQPKTPALQPQEFRVPRSPRDELQLTGDAWVPGGKGPGSGEARSSGNHMERICPGGRTLRAGDGAAAKRSPGNWLRGARRGSPRIPSLRRSPPG